MAEPLRGRTMTAQVDFTSQHTIKLLRFQPELAAYDGLRTRAKAEKDKEKKRSLTKQANDIETLLLPSLRADAEAAHLAYIDACFILTDEPNAAPIFGSGGNDGSRDFGVNFAEALIGLFEFELGSGEASKRARVELPAALFAEVVQIIGHGTMGQFGPGQGGKCDDWF
jgi:CRISPR-associated protein Csx17